MENYYLQLEEVDGHLLEISYYDGVFIFIATILKKYFADYCDNRAKE